jgi:hypothetical protein
MSEERRQQLLRDASFLDEMKREFDRKQNDFWHQLMEYLKEKGEL